MRPLAPACLLVLLAPVASGQPAVPAPGEVGLSQVDVGLSDSARVSLLTMLPGEEVYSLWGHNALRISDPAAGIDRAYNYGSFSFDQSFFVLRFLSGRLDYLLDTEPFAREVWKYQTLRRPIIEQTLDLPPETVRELYDLLEINALPENRAYRYDFLRDNCSTRLLDVINGALVASGHPTVVLPPIDGDVTFRELVRPYSLGHPSVDLGTMLGLGLPMDQVAESRAAIFLPDALLAAADDATVDGRPLVASRDTVFWIEGAGDAEVAFPWPVALGWLLGALGLATTAVGLRKPGPPGRALRLADATLFSLLGGIGLILLLLWIATEHYVTAANVELAWLWPTHLAAVAPLARPTLSARWRRYLQASAIVTGVVVGLWGVWPEPMHAALLPVAILAVARAASRGWAPGET
ncbi:MAG: DUF4105 domain-containing protein [Bacteroidota bacterium]